MVRVGLALRGVEIEEGVAPHPDATNVREDTTLDTTKQREKIHETPNVLFDDKLFVSA